MSIKSEKAKNAIKDVIPMYAAERAVEIAESEAEERFCAELITAQNQMKDVCNEMVGDAERRCRGRAVEAYKKTCGHYENGECGIAYGVEEFKPCADNGLCAGIERFKNNYDNEQ